MVANTNKPWMSNKYDIPVLDNEEMWTQEVIDDVVKDLFNEMDEENNNGDEKTEEPAPSKSRKTKK